MGKELSGSAYSINTELWFSDFFWLFFSNYSYEQITKLVLEVLIATEQQDLADTDNVPQELLDSFEKYCREANLLDKEGRFNDAYKLVELFCRKIVRRDRNRKNNMN